MVTPFENTSGPRNAKIAVVGEAHGEQEELTGLPLMGSSGQEFNRMLMEAGLNRNDIFCTNVFSLKPPANNVEALCLDKAGNNAQLPSLPTELVPVFKTPFRQGKYFSTEYYPHIIRLYRELNEVKPNLIIALGNTACWALLQTTRISSIRGAITRTVRGEKVLPTYHPAAVLRNWSLRTIVVADFLKAEREQNFPEIRRPERHIQVSPTISQIVQFFRKGAIAYAVDIETKHKQIEMISFARSPREAIVIPFIDTRMSGYNYWAEFEDELKAWHCVRAALECPIPKIFQNGMFDLQYLCRMGFRPRNCAQDTMLLHHSHFPEMRKGLGFLGSIYTNEAAWKLMRIDDSLKRDE